MCEHSIRNINCACQDAEDLSHFAYITRDSHTGEHFCHVFAAKNVPEATDIIMTIGQAFEVAYQLSLRQTGKAMPSHQHARSKSVSSVPVSTLSHTPLSLPSEPNKLTRSTQNLPQRPPPPRRKQSPAPKPPPPPNKPTALVIGVRKSSMETIPAPKFQRAPLASDEEF